MHEDSVLTGVCMHSDSFLTGVCMYAHSVLTGACMYAGGATAIIASQANPLPPWAGFSFILVMLVASAGQTVIAILVNNLHSKKRYPTYWFGGKL